MRPVTDSLVTGSIAQLRPYEAGKPLEELARELGVHDAIKLASNENALGTSPKALVAAQQAVHDLHRYPDAAHYELRHKLAGFLGVGPQEIALGTGSNELIDLIVRTFCTNEHHIVFADPSFVVYRTAALAHGVPHTAVPLRDYYHDLPAMTAALQPNTRVVFVANPNNPTGTRVTADALTAFVRSVPPEVIVVIDEAYIEYADPLAVNALTLRALHPRLVCLRTFSKIYGLAALRLGYAVATAEIVHYLDCVRAPFNVNSIAQAAGVAALDDVEHVAASYELNRSEKARISSKLAQSGVKVVPSQANFLLIELARPAQAIYQELLKRGVIVRPIAALPNCLRVTLGLPAENDRLLSSLAQVLA